MSKSMHPGWVVAMLGTAQTLSWASSYYLPAMLAGPMARDLGIGAPTVFAAFSGALVVSAFFGPWAGRAIDRRGGRPVLMGTNLLFALGLTALGMAQDTLTLFLAWALIGVAMSGGLYESAFATLVGLYGHNARNSITGITLIAGFASTVGWPLSAWMELEFGWRSTCFGWAALHLVLGLPLNALLPRSGQGSAAAGVPRPERPAAESGHGTKHAAPAQPDSPPTPATTSAPAAPAGSDRDRALNLAMLSCLFAMTGFISTAMAAHLPRMLQATGASLAVAVGVGILIGPAQVAGRLLEFGLLRRVHPLLSARIAALTHPLGIAALIASGPVLAPLFAVLHGAGNGVLTIAKGTLPLALFGPHGYGARQGWLAMPARVAQASAPVLFGLALDRWDAGVLWLSAGLGMVAFAAAMAMRAPRALADSRHRE